jgi:Reverse transcriptase (RNA-dependent DNA polymerase)
MTIKYGKWMSKSYFLNEDLEEKVYMIQPKGFVDPKNVGKICKLQRSIYGLISKYQGIGIFSLIKRTKSLILSNAKRNLVYIRN